MSQQYIAPEPSPTENVFEELEQELRRLKSAVSHLSLSESAATQAIEAAERVVQQQNQLSQQLTDYLSRLPEQQAEAAGALVAELSQAAAAQQQQALAQLAQQLTQGNTLPGRPVAEEPYRALAEKTEERQRLLELTLARIDAQLNEGIPHHLTQELDELLQQVTREATVVKEHGQVLSQVEQAVRNLASADDQASLMKQVQQVGQETAKISEQTALLKQVQKTVGEIAFSSGENLLQQQEKAAAGNEQSKLLNQVQQAVQEIKQGQQGLTAHLKSGASSRPPESMAAGGIQETLKQQFQQLQSQLLKLLEPSTKPKSPLPSTPDYGVRNKVDELSKKVNELTQLAAAQQRLLKRQQVFGLLTLLGVLAMLAAGFIKG
ncbi:methyl-accepting chemotaxis domain-containing protein [Hymenobacter psychrophilus]|uniref:Uncharacterized protein n=1 Tax=Hymenobacter psychrophilus TaxID=651662 RepID=A0A1H3KYE3_9BACT|nr:hypothetical protein [Hymenobacter psychrophilus]SDY56738.1 hypothetical protein SAMN04488069_1105 [Hymenobacter psychrophilus]